jgi:ABC-type transport system involved in cytochrome bd biosynthesis fused ATPase/permease subunit
MLAFLLKVGQSIVHVLPAAIARLLVLAVLLVALLLHVSASRRIEKLEVAETERRVQYENVINAVTELKIEVRGYRDDMRQENKALKEQRRMGRKE